MSNKPLLLIDVDGVLNPLCSHNKMPSSFRKYELDGYRVFLSRMHGDMLNGLTDKFDLVWATTWEDQANDLIGPRVGLPKLPVIHFSKSSYRLPNALTWKLAGVQDYVGDRRFAWIDDDLHEDAHGWADKRGHALLVDIDPLTGLTDTHVERLREWA